MSNDSKKLLTLGNVEHIKDYIDATSGKIMYYIDEEFKDAVNTKIEQAKGELNNSFIAKTTEITNKITLLEQTTGNKNEINELRLQLDAVRADNDAMNTALESLSKELETGLNDVSGSIMSAGQINDLVSTALINSVNISDDAVEAPTVYTQNLVALIGKFGQIRATNIVGSEISGKTVKSTDGSWELNNNGAGKLANGNITWTENGDVTFGPNVKLNWSNIEGSDDATDGVEAAMDAAIAAAAAAATAQAAANEATALANEAKNSIPSEARITEITRNSITTENITGTTLSGKTVKSTSGSWELNNNGAGKLANGNITWTEDGVVTLSDNVELKWGNITDAPTIPEGGGGLSETEVNDLIATQITNSGITAHTIEGKTIKSTDNKWELTSAGGGYLGNFDGIKAIEWGTDGVKIQGTNVEIAGDVKINGAAIITGITNNESAQESFNTMVADCIDAAEIKTEVLETKPDDNKDKIRIEDNYIYCIDNDSKRNLKISSDDINMNCLDALFTPISKDNDNIYNEVTSWTNAGTGMYGGSYYINNATVTSGQGTANVSSDATIDTINAGGKCTPIGYLFANTNISITLKVALCLFNNYWGSVNPKYEPVSGQYWNIIKGNAPVWGHTQAGTSNSSTGGYLLVYKLNNETGIYEPYKQYSLSGTWQTTGDINIGGMTINSSGNYKVKEVNGINIDSDGMYGVEIVFEVNSIKYEKTTTPLTVPRDMYINARFVIKTDSEMPEQYTEIGRNGLISFNKDTAISLDNNGAMLKSKILADDGVYNFYGIKVTTDGIYLGGGTAEWNKLDVPKLLELLSTTTTE